jgi:hypothetical protein
MQYQSNLLQSLGLQDIINMREREAVQTGQSIVQADMLRREEEAIRRQQEEQAKQRKAGVFTSILTLLGTAGGALLGGPAGAGIGASLGKGLGGMINKPSQSTTIATAPMRQYQPSSFMSQYRGGNYA